MTNSSKISIKKIIDVSKLIKNIYLITFLMSLQSRYLTTSHIMLVKMRQRVKEKIIQHKIMTIIVLWLEPPPHPIQEKHQQQQHKAIKIPPPNGQYVCMCV